MNSVYLKGNLTRNPEVRYFNNNTSVVANFGMAVNERWIDAQGKPGEAVHFIEVEAWNRQAQLIEEYFSKGMPIVVEGSLKFESWVDEASGENRNRLKVRLNRFEFVGANPNAGQTVDQKAA